MRDWTQGEVEAVPGKTGLALRSLAEGSRDARCTFADIVAQPRRVLTTPTWSAVVNEGRPYSPFTLNVEHLIPWRTLTGRQHFYLDHQSYIEWGEHLPIYKPRPDHSMLSEVEVEMAEAQGKLLNYITPHGKWSIHSTYSENLRMLTLSRGGYPAWLNDKDAAEMGIRDNDWAEIYNDNGVFVQRCDALLRSEIKRRDPVSSRRAKSLPLGTPFLYQAAENNRHLGWVKPTLCWRWGPIDAPTLPVKLGDGPPRIRL